MISIKIKVGIRSLNLRHQEMSLSISAWSQQQALWERICQSAESKEKLQNFRLSALPTSGQLDFGSVWWTMLSVSKRRLSYRSISFPQATLRSGQVCPSRRRSDILIYTWQDFTSENVLCIRQTLFVSSHLVNASHSLIVSKLNQINTPSMN